VPGSSGASWSRRSSVGAPASRRSGFSVGWYVGASPASSSESSSSSPSSESSSSPSSESSSSPSSESSSSSSASSDASASSDSSVSSDSSASSDSSSSDASSSSPACSAAQPDQSAVPGTTAYESGRPSLIFAINTFRSFDKPMRYNPLFSSSSIRVVPSASET